MTELRIADLKNVHNEYPPASPEPARQSLRRSRWRTRESDGGQVEQQNREPQNHEGITSPNYHIRY
jgi:hypothetical protein